MSAKHGSLSINSENIFPIIKKWLYSDHDIFVREMISNGCDAITKLRKLDYREARSVCGFNFLGKSGSEDESVLWSARQRDRCARSR